jgi:hypothetical protein
MRGSERRHLYVFLAMHLLVGLSNDHVPRFGFYPRILIEQIQQVTATQQF